MHAICRHRAWSALLCAVLLVSCGRDEAGRVPAKDRASSPPLPIDRAADTAAEARPATSPSPASPADEIIALVNEARRSERLGPLTPDATLQRLAERQARRMARAGRIFHNASLGKEMLSGTRWTQFAENVAVGPSIEEVHRGFLDSRRHRANILGDFTSVGAGVVPAPDGSLYVVEVFGLASADATGDTAETRSR